jgi:hypothetical protein
MKPAPEVETRIDALGRSLAEALGNAVVCIAVYGSAAGDDFSPDHSDVNLLVVLREVAFSDLRLIGETLRRAARPDLRIATPLVVTPSFLRDARDSYPIELADIRDRHRVLAGEDVVAGIIVDPEEMREQAEREVRGKLLALRALVVHRPEDREVQRALASAVSTFEVIERALLRVAGDGSVQRGVALFEEVERRQSVPMRALARLARLRAAGGAWPAGDELDELLAAALREVEALVAFVDGSGA